MCSAVVFPAIADAILQRANPVRPARSASRLYRYLSVYSTSVLFALCLRFPMYRMFEWCNCVYCSFRQAKIV